MIVLDRFSFVPFNLLENGTSRHHSDLEMGHFSDYSTTMKILKVAFLSVFLNLCALPVFLNLYAHISVPQEIVKCAANVLEK